MMLHRSLRRRWDGSVGIDNVRVAENLDQIPQIEGQYNGLRSNVRILSQQKFKTVDEINKLKEQIKALQNNFRCIKS